jgi:ribosome-associated toxin RatA of RatAB toxin-antitoxin module
VGRLPPPVRLPPRATGRKMCDVAGLTHYSFTSVWHVAADPDDLFEVLSDIGDYPAWWPEVKQMVRIGENRVAARVRSFLPYELDFEMEQVVKDRGARVLEVRMAGDLEGFSRWTLSPSGDGSRLLFEEDVEATKRLLVRFAPVARPAFKLNHSFMMRHGEAGLRTYMAGFRRASKPADG